jgi:hypothetical protein
MVEGLEEDGIALKFNPSPQPLYDSFYWTWINFCWLILSGSARQLDQPWGHQARGRARSVVPVFNHNPNG